MCYTMKTAEGLKVSQTNQATRTEEIGLGGPESHPLPSRLSVKPTDPAYDDLMLAYIKSRLVVDANGCWLWQGFIHPDSVLKSGPRTGDVVRGGYGKTSYRGRSQPVHRVMWTILRGAPPPKIQVCHTCDVRHCCNPDHLWLGTNQQNIQDMVNKGRGPCGEKAKKTHCVRGHAYAEYGFTCPSNPTFRKCKICDRITQRMKAGWSEEEAINTPPYAQGAPTPRRDFQRIGRMTKRYAK